jgi:hypothetical protein
VRARSKLKCSIEPHCLWQVFGLDDAGAFPQEAKKGLLAERDKLEKEAHIGVFYQRTYRSHILMGLIQTLTLAANVIFLFFAENLTRSESLVALVLSVIMIGFTSIFSIVSVWSRRSKAKKAVQSVCFYTAVCAAEFLDQGNLIAASHYAEGLFGSIKWFAEDRRIGVGIFGESNLRDIYRGDIDKLWEYRKAISKAVMDQREMSNQFSQNFYSLSENMFSKKGHNFNKALTSLQFFVKIGEQQKEPAGFLERHHSTLKGMGILYELLKATVAYILLFVLWILFRYHG